MRSVRPIAVPIAIKEPHPQIVSENNLESSRSASGLFILANKRAADRWLHIKDVEELRADLQSLDILRTLFVNERITATAIDRHAVERPVLISEIEEVRIRKQLNRWDLSGSLRFVLPIATSRFGDGNGSGFNNTALTTLKIAVFAPIPSARVSTATRVNPGDLRSWRKASFKHSFHSVRSASIGSTREALHAGITQAHKATKPSRATPAVKLVASSGTDFKQQA